MAQGIFGGATSYDEQSLKDIQLDCEKWVEYTKDIKKAFEEGINKSKANKFWGQVPWNFQATLVSSITCFDTYLHDFSMIINSISKGEITKREVQLLYKIGIKAMEFNCEYGKSYKEESRWKKYGDADFMVIERLYADGRDFFVTLQDAANASNRLNDYVSALAPTFNNNVTQTISGNGNQVSGINNGTMTLHSNNQIIEDIKTAIPLVEKDEDIDTAHKEYIVDLLRESQTAITNNDKVKQEGCIAKLKAFIIGAGDKALKVIAILGSFASIGSFFGIGS